MDVAERGCDRGPCGQLTSVQESAALITTRGASAEWPALERAIAEAMTSAGADAVSADHPCAGLVKGCPHSRLAQELRGLGRWQEGCYTRTTLVHTEEYVVLLLCWSPGVSSPVHAHCDAESGVKSNCFMRILEGELCETFYESRHVLGSDRVAADGGAERMLPAGAYAYINDEIGVHKVGNASGTERAVSLHVYAPGWKTVQLYDEVEPADAGGAALNLDAWGDF